jgi:UDP-N-acetylglucosamine 2-epimerase (non-hydrolysing)
MRIVTIVGARPQFVKTSLVSKVLREEHNEILVHTGQHYDYEMSKVFFEGLSLPEPDYNLEVGSGRHGEQTGKMLAGLEQVMLNERPNIVLVYGDTNSTLAGALAAAKLNIPVAHVEAGLRSFNRQMPEEINRVVTDHISELLFCPTQIAVENLKSEGIKDGVWWTGDVMLDALLGSIEIAEDTSEILDRLGLDNESYLLATVHRASNTDNRNNLSSIVDAFLEIRDPVVMPLHPRAERALKHFGLYAKLSEDRGVILTRPLGYLDFIKLERHARIILTDSGGVQKEAYFLQRPCITLREETEWIETLEHGWNVLVGSNKKLILSSVREHAPFGSCNCESFGDGRAARTIAKYLSRKRVNDV